jgi:hypothetical protein
MEGQFRLESHPSELDAEIQTIQVRNKFLFKSVKTCQNLSKLVETCRNQNQNLSELVKTC